MKTDNDDRLRQELRLAQLEIKVLREQLLKSAQETQRTRDKMEELSRRLIVEEPPKEVPPVAKKKNGAPTQRGTHNGKPRVLCVEDSEPNYRLIESVLEERPGIELIWAQTGESALQMAQEKRPQLVLLDLDLPDIHGSKVLERLHAEPETLETPVIVISADATPSQIERMLSAGARNYLTKPFEIRRFLFMFDEIMAVA
jgi:CheY-like chemotaxis protein